MTTVAVASLYTLLGVARTASAAEIKAAYRQKAKAAHPDQGGSRDEFEALNKAKDLLLDPKRRAKYDATGNADEEAPSNDHIRVLELIDGMINDFLNDEKLDLRTFDIVGAMKNHMLDAVRKGQEAKFSGRAKIARAEKIVARFRFKKNSTIAPLKMAMQNNIDKQKQRVESFDKDIAMFERVLKALDTISYTLDAPEQGDQWLRHTISQGVRGFGFGSNL